MADANYANSTLSNQYLQGGLEIYTSTSNGVVTVTAKLYARRTNVYSGVVNSSSVTRSITIDGSKTEQGGSMTVNGGQQNVWQGPMLTATKTFTGASKSITISWAMKDNVASNLTGSGSTSFTVPNGYVAPSGLSVSLVGKTHDTVTLKVGVNSYGIPASADGRTLTAMVLAKDGTTLVARRVNDYKNVSSVAEAKVTNSSDSYGGSLTISGNNTYSIGVWATNTKMETYSITKNGVTTVCPPLTSLAISGSQTYTAYNKVNFNMAWARPADGNALARTLFYRVSTDNGATYGGWVSAGTVANATTSGTIAITNIDTAKSVKIQAKMTTTAGDSGLITSATITTLATHTAPNFSNFTYADTKSAVTTLTGSNQVLIQGQSTPRVTISSANKATGNQSIAVQNYSISFSGATYTANWASSGDVTKDLTAPTQNGTLALKVSAVDALSLSTAVTKNVTVIPWSAPVINASVERTSGFESESTLKIKGSYSQLLVGSTVKNTIAVAYRAKKSTSSSWDIDWTARTATISGSDWTTTDLVLSLDNNSQWNVEVRAVDKFTTTTVAMTVSVGVPKFFIGKDGRVSVGGKPSRALVSNTTGQLEVNGFIWNKNGLVMQNSGSLYQKTSLNSYTDPGIYRIQEYPVNQIFDSSATNTFWGDLIVVNEENYVQQIMIANYDINGSRMAIRTSSNGGSTWNGWVRIPVGPVNTANIADKAVTLAKVDRTSSGAWNEKIAVVSGNVLEICKYLDFHNTNTSTNDYDTRLQCEGATKNVLKLPTVSGNLISTGTPTWTTFVRNSATTNTNVSLTSLRGNTYTATFDNGGTVFRITNGASNVNMFRQIITASYSSTITSNIGIHNVKSGSTTWCYWVGASNGSYQNKGENHATDSGQEYGDCIVSNANKNNISISITGTRINTSNVWSLHAEMQFGGSATSFNANIECTARDANSLPTVYQRGATSSNVTYVRNVIELLEE